MTLVKAEKGRYYNHHCDGEPVDSTGKETGESCDKKVMQKREALIKAVREGWFFSKDNRTAYCPDCIPEDIKQWRKRKRLIQERERERKNRG